MILIILAIVAAILACVAWSVWAYRSPLPTIAAVAVGITLSLVIVALVFQFGDFGTDDSVLSTTWLTTLAFSLLSLVGAAVAVIAEHHHTLRAALFSHRAEPNEPSL